MKSSLSVTNYDPISHNAAMALLLLPWVTQTQLGLTRMIVASDIITNHHPGQKGVPCLQRTDLYRFSPYIYSLSI